MGNNIQTKSGLSFAFPEFIIDSFSNIIYLPRFISHHVFDCYTYVPVSVYILLNRVWAVDALCFPLIVR